MLTGKLERDASNAEIMAMPTAGGDQVDSEANELRDLDFADSRLKLLNNSSSAHIKKPGTLSGNRSRHSRQGSKQSGILNPPYENEQRIQKEMKSQVINDEAFIKKV